MCLNYKCWGVCVFVFQKDDGCRVLRVLVLLLDRMLLVHMILLYQGKERDA